LDISSIFPPFHKTLISPFFLRPLIFQFEKTLLLPRRVFWDKRCAKPISLSELGQFLFGIDNPTKPWGRGAFGPAVFFFDWVFPALRSPTPIRLNGLYEGPSTHYVQTGDFSRRPRPKLPLLEIDPECPRFCELKCGMFYSLVRLPTTHPNP